MLRIPLFHQLEVSGILTFKKYLKERFLKLSMAFFEDKLLLVVIGVAIFYFVYRLFFAVGKADKLYQETVKKIMNSEEYKVKGRFD